MFLEETEPAAKGGVMVKAVVFDMYETLVTLFHGITYMGKEISADAGIPEPVFREIWDATNIDRTLGRMTYEEVIERILKVNGRYSDELFDMLVSKRKAAKAESFNCIHDGIIPMFESLKARGIKIGLITNCYLEEKDAIEDSVLFPYFDVACMSCELGLHKPDESIFRYCLEKMGVEPEECIYCGDGESHELEAAKAMNMRPVQALWYLREGIGQTVGRMPEYEGVKEPADLIELLGGE